MMITTQGPAATPAGDRHLVRRPRVLTVRVARNLALPPSYFWLVAREIDIIGVRSLVVALTAALFTGMVLALQTAVNMARFGAENYVGPGWRSPSCASWGRC